MLLATLVVIVATLAQIAFMVATRRRVHLMLWVSLALVVVLGGATVWFHSETFIKWKPSVLYWAMGLAFLLGPPLFGRNLPKALMGQQMELPALAWQRLNLAWVGFFAVMGALNLYVAYSFPTDVWVNFKLFGGTGLMLLFVLAQGLFLSRHMKADDASAAPGETR